MRCGAWRLVALLAACSRVAAFDVEGGALGRPPLPRQGAGVASRGPQQQQQLGVRGIGGSVEAATAKISGWYRAYQSFVAAAAKVSQLISFCCGVWLVMSTPLTMLGAAFSVKITETAMVLLLGVYGLLMLGVEVPVGALQTMLRQYFFFVYTRPGRAAFVLNVALMAWSLTTVRPVAPGHERRGASPAWPACSIACPSTHPTTPPPPTLAGGLHHQGADDLQRDPDLLYPQLAGPPLRAGGR
jgi:hypothetical protein